MGVDRARSVPRPRRDDPGHSSHGAHASGRMSDTDLLGWRTPPVCGACGRAFTANTASTVCDSRHLADGCNVPASAPQRSAWRGCRALVDLLKNVGLAGSSRGRRSRTHHSVSATGGSTNASCTAIAPEGRRSADRSVRPRQQPRSCSGDQPRAVSLRRTCMPAAGGSCAAAQDAACSMPTP